MAPTFLRRFPVGALLLSACALIVSGSLARNFEYDRTAIKAGQLWRLLTGHWTHWSSNHLFWDVATFAALGLLAERRRRAAFLACAFVAATAISASLWFLRPDVTVYRGLSGIDVGLFTLVAIGMFRDARATHRRATAGIAVAALVTLALKLTWEVTPGTALFVDAAAAGFQSLPIAHAVGGVTGMLCGFASPNGDAHSPRPTPPIRLGPR